MPRRVKALRGRRASKMLLAWFSPRKKGARGVDDGQVDAVLAVEAGQGAALFAGGEEHRQ
jgi:hypothetical protein